MADSFMDWTKDIFTFLDLINDPRSWSKTQVINTQDLLANIKTSEIFDKEKDLALALVEKIGQSQQQIKVKVYWSEDDHVRTGCITRIGDITFEESFRFILTQRKGRQFSELQMDCLDRALDLPTATYDQLCVVGTLLEAVTKSLSA
jgi:hypothetical protein